jgi:hypothetical protein
VGLRGCQCWHCGEHTRAHAAVEQGWPTAGGGVGQTWRCASYLEAGVRARCCAETATGEEGVPSGNDIGGPRARDEMVRCHGGSHAAGGR